MTGEWGPGNVFDDDFFDLEASQWTLPSTDALWDSLHEEDPTQGFPAFRRRDKQRERLRYPFQTTPSLRVAFRREESSESPSQNGSEGTKIVTLNSKEKKKDVERKKELKSPSPNTSVTPNSSANNNVLSQTTTEQPAAMATIAPFTYPVYQAGVGQWGPNLIHPHIPLLPGFLPPAGMAPAMMQPAPTILPVVIYSSPPTGPVMMGGGGGPMMMGSGPVTMGGGGPMMMGSGPVTMGGGGPVTMMGSGPVTMGGGGPVMMGSGPVTMGGGGLAQVSAFPMNNAVQPATNVPSGNTMGGNMQPSTWLNHHAPENTAMKQWNHLLNNRQTANDIVWDLLRDIIEETVPGIFSDLKEESFACCGWFASDMMYLAACGIVEDIVSEVVYSASSGIVSDTIDDLHKEHVNSPKRILHDTILTTAMSAMNSIIDEIVRNEANDVMNEGQSMECITGWLEEYVSEVVTDCYHEEVFAETTKRQKQVASIVSEHIVEPELFEEALGLALDPSSDTLLDVNTLHDCILDELLFSCVLSHALNQ